MKEDPAVSGIFRIKIDLPGEKRRPHDVGRAELDLALDRNTAGRNYLRDDIAEQRTLGVDLRRDDNRPGGKCRTGWANCSDRSDDHCSNVCPNPSSRRKPGSTYPRPCRLKGGSRLSPGRQFYELC